MALVPTGLSERVVHQFNNYGKAPTAHKQNYTTMLYTLYYKTQTWANIVPSSKRSPHECIA